MFSSSSTSSDVVPDVSGAGISGGRCKRDSDNGQRPFSQVTDYSPGIFSELLEGWFEPVPDRFESAGSILRRLLLRRSRQLVRRMNRKKVRLTLRGKPKEQLHVVDDSTESNATLPWSVKNTPGFFERWTYIAQELCEGWNDGVMESSSSSLEHGSCSSSSFEEHGTFQNFDWERGPTSIKMSLQVGRWARRWRRISRRKQSARATRRNFHLMEECDELVLQDAVDYDGVVSEILEECVEEEQVERWVWFRVDIGQSLFVITDGTENAILRFGEGLSSIVGGAAVGYTECAVDLNCELVAISAACGSSLAEVACVVNKQISPTLTYTSSMIAEYGSWVSYATCRPALQLHLRASALGSYFNHKMTPYVICISSSVTPYMAAPAMMATKIAARAGKVLQPLAASTHSIVAPIAMTFRSATAPLCTRVESVLVPCVVVISTPFSCFAAVVRSTIQPCRNHVAAALSPLTSQVEAYTMILSANMAASLTPLLAPDDPVAHLRASYHALWAPWAAAMYGLVQPWRLQAAAVFDSSALHVMLAPASAQVNAALAPMAADMNAVVSPLLWSIEAAAAPVTSSIAATLVPIVADLNAYTTPIAVPFAASAISASQRFHAYVAPSVATASACCSPTLAYIGTYTMPIIGGAGSGLSECIADGAGEFVVPTWLWVNANVVAPGGSAAYAVMAPIAAQAAQQSQGINESMHFDVQPTVASAKRALSGAKQTNANASTWEVGLQHKRLRCKRLRRSILRQRQASADDWQDIIEESQICEVQEYSVDIRQSSGSSSSSIS